jgi:Sec-independent protein secretion pathway component TatC
MVHAIHLFVIGGDYSPCILVPYPFDFLQLVWVYPWFQDQVILVVNIRTYLH